jgi:hypothetical protein
MSVFIEGFQHRTGEHCASTAIRNMLGHHGLSMSEAMVVGLAGGLGFFYLRNDALSPTRMFHGRTPTLELDFCENAALPAHGGESADDQRALEELEACLDRGIPVMLSTDTFYLGYQNTTSHFPGHRAVVVGYDEDEACFWMADRKLEEYQRVSYEELRRARNADDYPISCRNEYNFFEGEVRLGRPLGEAIRIALKRNAESMLNGSELDRPGASSGIKAIRELANELPSWHSQADWSWSSRFGYQVIVKRGSGGLFFRSLYRDFLVEAAEAVPRLGEMGLAVRMATIAERWGDLAEVLKEQSERETCEPELFREASRIAEDLADREELMFRELTSVAADDSVWATADPAHTERPSSDAPRSAEDSGQHLIGEEPEGLLTHR